jgi:sulfonate transport system substrate-binding protein
VIDKQLQRTELTHGPIGKAQADTIIAAGLALQEAGVLDKNLDVKGTVAVLIDPQYLSAKTQ